MAGEFSGGRRFETYEGWADAVLSRLALVGDEVVLELGCEFGQNLFRALRLLPSGKVVGVDDNPKRLDVTRSLLASERRRVDLYGMALDADLSALPIFDAAFSVRSMSRYSSQSKIFRNLFGQIRPGGRLSMEMGSSSNLANFLKVVDDTVPETLAGTSFYNPTPDAVYGILSEIGFTDIEVLEVDSPVEFESRELFEAYVYAAVAAPYLDDPDGVEQKAAVSKLLSHMPTTTLDFVRLTLFARTPL